MKLGQTPPVLNPYADLHGSLTQLPFNSEALMKIRRKLVAAYAWAIPSPAALEAISRHGPIVELGAGTGYWKFCLQQLGVDIIAFDRNAGAPPHWSTIEPGDESVLANPSSPLHLRTLFLCWPPLEEPLASRALHLYQGNTVIEIGEPAGGRTGNAEFASLLESRWHFMQKLELPQWPGYHDELRIWTRTP